MARRTNRLSFERLESRELMHGNVIASIVNAGSGPFLFVTEAAGDVSQANTVQVSRLANGKVRVTGGTNSDGTFTRVNGLAGQDFILPTTSDLSVFLGGGDDQLRVTNARFGNVFVGMNRSVGDDADTVLLSGLKIGGKVRVDTGDGADRVTVRSSTFGDAFVDDAAINTGAGADRVDLSGLTAFGPVAVDTGAGADQTFVHNANFLNDLNVVTGGGADTTEVGAIGGAFVRVKGNLIVNTFHDINEPDADQVRISQTFGDKLIAVDTGAGDDFVRMVNVAGHDVVLVAGKGNDNAGLTEVTAASQIFLAMSEDNDTLNMTFVQATDLLSVDGGTGFDRLEHHQDAHNAHTQFTGWEVINGLSMTINPDLIGGVIGTAFAR